jgi:hypothetical protein
VSVGVYDMKERKVRMMKGDILIRPAGIKDWRDHDFLEGDLAGKTEF